MTKLSVKVRDLSSDELAHYGKLGMKWGKRKNRTPSSDHDEVRNLKAKKVSELSNAELRKLNDRKQLEKKYKDLNPDAVKQGRNYVAGAIALAGTIVAVQSVLKGPVGQMGKAAVEKAVKASMSNAGRHVVVEAVKATGKHVL